MSAPEQLTSQQKMDALQSRNSNTEEVAKIESAGHTASTTITVATIGYGAIGAAGTGGIGAVACYAAPLAAGIAGAMAGAALVNHFALDEKLLAFMGKPVLAKPGPQPATIGHDIAHSSPFAGALGGLLAGVVVGALCAVAVSAVVVSGGLAAPLLIGAAAGLGGGFAGALVNGFFSKAATVTGKIITGSPNVFFEGKPVARVTDLVACSKHSVPPLIAEGSETTSVNGLPLARIGHKTTCGATIQQGCKTIFGDSTTGQYGPIDSQMSVFEQSIVSIAEVALCFSAVRFRSSKLGKKIFGEPIDPSDGSYVDFRTDFEYPGILPLKLTRTYSGRDNVQGLLGSKWICNWSQRLVYDAKEPTVNLEDGDGEILQFSLGNRIEFTARNLKAPHYHLSGTRQKAFLLDTRSQQTLVFTTCEDSPDSGRLTSIEDRNGNRIDFIYSGVHLRRVVHSDGTTFVITSSALGNIESIAVEESSRLQPLVQYGYNPAGELTWVQGLFSGEFHYTYTKQGWLNHWHDSGATTVDLEYDAEGRVIATRTPDGMYNDRFVYSPGEKKTEYFDATGGCTSHWFNDNDLLIREQDPLGNITTHAIDGLDRVLSTTDALGRTTTFSYGPYGNLIGETDWTGRSTRIAYDKQGLITQIDYPDGTSATWKYDQRGNLLEAREPDGSTRRFSYDDNGRCITETGPDGVSSRLGYDRRGRPAFLRNALGETTGIIQDQWGRLLEISDPAGHTTRYGYEPGPDNPRGNLSRIIHPDGGEERFAYDREGLLASHIAGEDQTTRYRHGAFDLLRGVIDAKGQITTLDYDNAARLKRITNAAGQTWTYSYDLAGQLSMETDWAGRQTRYVRDSIGRVTSKRLPDGVEQRLTWDELDRIVAVDTARQRISYEYDQADRLIRAATYSTEKAEPASELLFSYDDKGRLAKEIQNGTAIEYRYDSAGRCISRTSPAGETGFSFDLLGQFKGLNSNSHVLEFKRNSMGLETERCYRSGGATEQERSQSLDAFSLQQSYDPCGRLKSQRAGQGNQHTARERLAELTRRFNWDKSGRLVGVEDNKRGSSDYQYDPRDQVNRITRQTGLNKQTEETYRYDALMNLAQSDGRIHQYSNGEIRHIGRSSYRHDTRGRLVEKRIDKNGFRPRTWYYRWDDFDRLIETHTPDGEIWAYTYDAFGRRIKKECVKSGNSGRTSSVTYLWQGATLAEEHRTTGEISEVSRWHFEPGTFDPLAKETISAEGKISFYPIVTDHLGTPKELFDTEGNCVWRAEHSLWGETTIAWQKQKAENHLPLVDCSLRFQNQWEDEESGLYYNLHRYYDPDSGQYLSQDPIGLEGGLRTHGYVHDPMQWVDPLGLAGCPSSGKSTSIQKFYPNNDGYIGARQRKFLMPGEKFDRYGGTDYSRFFSPAGTPEGARALPPGTAGQKLRTFEVVKPFEVEYGNVAPAYGELGMGTQITTPVRLKVLLDRGIIREI
jgi:RHS repeat-associated protein